MILIGNACSGVSDLYLQKAVLSFLQTFAMFFRVIQGISLLDSSANDSDRSICWSELESVRLEVEDDLLDSLGIRAHNEAVVALSEPNEFSSQFDSLGLRLVCLDQHDFIDNFPQVEVMVILSKLTLLHLRQI